ncbi:unnamed protein product [Urochloa humidicola]
MLNLRPAHHYFLRNRLNSQLGPTIPPHPGPSGPHDPHAPPAHPRPHAPPASRLTAAARDSLASLAVPNPTPTNPRRRRPPAPGRLAAAQRGVEGGAAGGGTAAQVRGVARWPAADSRL